MAINPDIRDQAYQFFIEEAPELLHTLETGLLTLSQDHNIANVHSLMRAAHTLKGGAASVGLEPIATIAHRLEAILKAFYSDTITIDTDLENQLLQAYDCLRLPLMEQINTGTFDAEYALAVADPIFSQIEVRCGEALNQAEAYIPSSTELGIDMVVSIFEVDVAQGIQFLFTVADNPQSNEVAGALRAQLEIFAGFAELLNLPEFATIVTTVQQALAVHPDRALEITRLAITDLEQYRQAVLAGNRTQAVELSAALVSLATNEQSVEAYESIDYKVVNHESISHEVTHYEVANELIHTEVVDIDIDVDTVIETVSEFNQTETEGSEASVSEPILFNSLQEIDLSLLESIFGGESDSFLTNNEENNLTGEEIDSLTQIEQPEENEITELDIISESKIEAIETEAIDTEYTSSIFALAPVSGLVPAQHSESIQLRNPLDWSHPRGRSEAMPHQEPVFVSPNLTVRVDSDRLERMNSLLGELSIGHNGLFLQNDQLQGTIRELLTRFSRFQALVGQLQQLSDQMLVAPERQRTGIKFAPTGNGTLELNNELAFPLSTAAYLTPTPDAVEFDSLEMDTYGSLHFQLQGILEEMVQLEEAVDDVAFFARQSHQMLHQQRPMLAQLQDEVTWARMVPIGEVLNRFPRMLRDLSATYHKPVNLKLIGTEVLVDKAILEKLYDPLLHLIRNAFDHGIEPPAIRMQRGKTEQGEIEIRTYHRGNQTMIEVKDDGQGLNLDRIRDRIFELGWMSANQLVMAPPAQLFEYIFEPGFSTAHQVSKLSGRGVGLDVVRSQLQAVKGTVSVESFPGKGTTFTLRLPLMLTIAKLIICRVSSATLALSIDSMAEILTPGSTQIRQSGSQRFLYWQGQIIPIYRLLERLDYRCPLPETPSSSVLTSIVSPKEWAAPMLIFRKEQQVFALEVDQVITEQELVIKPLSPTIASPSYTYGCTILADGSLVPVIDAMALLASELDSVAESIVARAVPTQTAYTTKVPAALPANIALPPAKTMPSSTILVVDDAATLRRSLALSLERSGFRVMQARDGREALDQLQQRTSIQLVVCDIEMPNMNGFEFLNHRRQDPQLSKIPVVILTSRSNEKHRWLAMQLGATAYFTKPYLEQEFLQAINSLIYSP